MEEKIKTVLEAYDFSVKRVSRGRGSFICDTNEGVRLVKAYRYSPERLAIEQLVKYTVRDRGFMEVDQFLPNREGEYLTKNDDEQMYVVKNWYEGHECDSRNAGELTLAARQLASLHQTMKHAFVPDTQRLSLLGEFNMLEIFIKHRNELKRIRNYIRQKKSRNEFEQRFIYCYDIFFAQADRAIEGLAAAEYQEIYKEAWEERYLCHGDFNHHQLLISKNRTAIVNFDHMHVDDQVIDLYSFLRKVMEKNKWDTQLGFSILNAYFSIQPLDTRHLKYLYCLLLFPEKFWKIANRYFNARKSWISGHNLEKFRTLMNQERQRMLFIDALWARIAAGTII